MGQCELRRSDSTTCSSWLVRADEIPPADALLGEHNLSHHLFGWVLGCVATKGTADNVARLLPCGSLSLPSADYIAWTDEQSLRRLRHGTTTRGTPGTDVGALVGLAQADAHMGVHARSVR